MRSVRRLHKKSIVLMAMTRVEAGLNTSAVTLRVVGGDEKGSLKSDSDPRKTTLVEPEAYTKDRPVLSSERAPQKTRP
jgi:poly(3-hydroxybutyrate) depolymerase